MNQSKEKLIEYLKEELRLSKRDRNTQTAISNVRIESIIELLSSLTPTGVNGGKKNVITFECGNCGSIRNTNGCIICGEE